MPQTRTPGHSTVPKLIRTLETPQHPNLREGLTFTSLLSDSTMTSAYLHLQRTQQHPKLREGLIFTFLISDSTMTSAYLHLQGAMPSVLTFTELNPQGRSPRHKPGPLDTQ